MLKRVAVFAGVALMMLSCAKGTPKAEPTPTFAPPLVVKSHGPGNVAQIVRAHVKLDVTGSATLHIEEEMKLNIVTIEGDRQPLITHFFSVVTAEAVDTHDGNRLLFDADLAPGLWDGPHEYQLSPTPPPSAVVGQAQSPLPSAAYVQILTPASKPYGPKFSVLLEPCTLVVDPFVAGGHVTCPKLGAENGPGSARLEFTWRRL